MKSYLKFTLLFIFISTYSIAQNGNAFYVKRTNNQVVTSIDNKEISNDVKKVVSKFSNTLKTFEYKLEFNPRFGAYKKIKKMEDSSLKNKVALALSGFKGEVFFNRYKKEIINKKNVFGTDFLIVKNFDSIKWELTKEKLIINELICYKAKTKIQEEGRNGVREIEIVAWYTPDVNIPFGPDGYGGLPGLIIQLEKGNIVTVLHKIEFIDTKTNIELPTKGKVVTEKEFNAFMKDLVMNREKYYNKQ
jgi:GLPGLI family protein